MMPVIPLRAFEAAPRIVVLPVELHSEGKIHRFWNGRVYRWHRRGM